MKPNFRDNTLIPIWEKIQHGERLSLEDGVAMYNTPDLISLGKMAHFVQQQKSGDAVYFVLNRKIEPTNLCVLSCKFCDFATKPGDPDAYAMTIEEILSKLTPDLREVHITGGMPAHWGWDYYISMVREIRQKFPTIGIKAFTAVEIDFFQKKFKMPAEEILRQLKEAGLDSMPGGGAEVFSERVRRLLFNQKIGGERWLAIHRIAHRMGIQSNATILYGHIETHEERLIHLIKLRELQDETGGFMSFIPLAFQPGDTGIKAGSHFTSAIDDLKTIAISRLMLDNFPHIKAYWVMLTEEVASVALNFGADDMDGTVGKERIAHDAGAISPMELAKEKLIKIIGEAGKVAIERDLFYNPMTLHGDRVVGRIPYLNSVPFHSPNDHPPFKNVVVTPRRLGILQRQGDVAAGLFSLMDYFESEDSLELLGYCIATRDQVKSVLLFSKYGWSELEGMRIGVVDDTATSVRLLQVLLEKKYGVRSNFVRLATGTVDYSTYDAVLMIGDEALRRNYKGLDDFELVFDLAREWYEWKKMPFVFAIWAVQKDETPDFKNELSRTIGASLQQAEGKLANIGKPHAIRLGLKPEIIEEYLAGFTYRLGEREREAMEEFRGLAGLQTPINGKIVMGQEPS